MSPCLGKPLLRVKEIRDEWCQCSTSALPWAPGSSEMGENYLGLIFFIIISSPIRESGQDVPVALLDARMAPAGWDEKSPGWESGI